MIMISILSATLFAISLLIPQLSIIAMTSFLIPLFFKKQKIKDGLFWGIIVFSTYWWWLLVLLENNNDPSKKIIGLIFFILLILWCSILSSTWFYFFNKYPITSTTSFFLLITQYSMIIIGTVEGMPLFSPLVMLAQYPRLLIFLPWTGDIGMLLILFGIQSWVANQIKNKNKLGVAIYFLSIVFLQYIACYTKQEIVREIPQASVVVPWWYKKGDGMFCGYRLSHDLCSVASKQTSKIIITPESTFCFDLEQYQEFIPIWCESANDIPILLAAHCFKNNRTHNCIVLLHNNAIQLRYFKQHSMPLVEKNVWFERLLPSPILSKELIPNTQEKHSSNDLIQIGDQRYQLFICSELFFETKKVSGYPVLLLWNDTWLGCAYAKKLALLFINYFEKKYRVVVYHVATTGLTNIKY
jgi:hypothetical protein